MVVSKRLIFALLTLLFSFPTFAITSLETSIDRNPAVEGEYLVLTINADDDIKTSKLDTSALLKDFIVGRTSVSRSTQIVNFDSKKMTRWQVLLAPKHTGNITIPALTIDGVSSKPITLNVVTSGSQPEQMKNLFIRTSLSTDEAYVGQLITYKVKLFLAVDLQRGVLSAPTLEGALIKQLGEDVDTTEIFNGRRYRVIERTYGVIADLPGELTIDGTGFSGDVLVQGSRRGGMFSFNESRPMEAKAAKSILHINPIPNEYHGEWLVSDLVALNEEWPEETQEYRVGDPITRTIMLLASNTDETSLPEFTIPTPDGLKTYPEKPLRKTFLRDKQLVSQITQTLAIVPTQPGTYTLPAIKVPWWNPHTKRQEEASLPARSIEVLGSSAQEVNLPQMNIESHSGSASQYWIWLSFIFATLWLITLFQLIRISQRTKKLVMAESEAMASSGPSDSPRHEAQKQRAKTQSHQSLSSLALLESACNEQEPGKVLTALQVYFSEQYTKPMSLSDIAALSTDLNAAISQLQVGAFSKEKAPLDYHKLLIAVKSISIKTKATTTSALVSLNPK
ncbi:BatD family protein [Shewanella sp. UCD-KL12]|uniref:BatD family protein n=1 Tax=Shewanella sp. UCD-KL12 TaxID=1917163 RepID=UPI0009709BEC|nr:BatD family protein [Shewanella sp. UCD-KL12]